LPGRQTVQIATASPTISQRLIGELGQGFKIALHVLELFRPTVGPATLGFARRAMSEAVERSVERHTFKKPISEHQLIQAKLADMAVGMDAAALLVYRAAWQHDATERSISREAAIAKLYSTETAFDIIDQSRRGPSPAGPRAAILR
jgi:acyl-CoA dehydrogenase